MIAINANGSKWAGQNPDSIDGLLDMLSKYALDSTFEDYGNFIITDPISAFDEKPLYASGTVHFWGNFSEWSHVFDIATDEPETIKKLTDAIRANQASDEYLRFKTERLARRQEEAQRIAQRHKGGLNKCQK